MTIIVNKVYLIVLLVLLVLFSLLAFLPFGSSANPVAVMRTMDAGHAFAFILLSAVLYLAVEPYGKWRAVITSSVLSVLLMVVVELVQPYVGRTASFADIQEGLLGVVLALSGMIVWRCQSRRLLKIAHLLLLLLSLAWVVNPALSEWRALWLREQQFPVLGSFDADLEKRLWMAHGKGTVVSFSDRHVITGESSLKIKTSGDTWSGIRYAAGDQDWRGYESLSLDIYNTGLPFLLSIRIDDGVSHSPDYGDRFDGRFLIATGANTLLIPLDVIAAGPKSRLLALDKIRKVILFLSKEETQRVFYLDNVHLGP